MGGIVSAIGDVVSGVAEAVGDVVEVVVENPIIAAAAMAVTGVPLPGVIASLPAPVSAAAISMASTAIQGGDFGDIIKSGAAGALGSVVGGAVGSTVASSFGDTAGKIASSAAGGFTGTLVATGDLETALKGGVMGGAGAALQAGISSGLQAIKEQFPGTTTTQAASPSGLQVGQRVPTSPFGTFETVAQTSPQWSPTSPLTRTFDTLPSREYNPSFVERAIGAAGPAATELATDALKPTLASALGFGGQPTTQSTGPAPTGGQGGPGVAVTGEGTAVNPAAASALAQALRVGDPGAPLFGTEGKGQQQAVWNTASLKFKDEIGG
jgi:hypothetical protein